MKKVLALPLFAMAALVSQSWGAWTACKNDAGKNLYCQWETSCYAINKGETDSKDCATELAGCIKDGYVYTDVTKTTDQDATITKCNGTWTGEGKGDPNNIGALGYCDWGDCVFDPDNDYACLSGGCFEIMNETEAADCNSKLTSKSQCPKSSLPKADGGTGGGNPILKFIPVNTNLLVATYGRSLHISSAKGAIVSLYDMSGVKVYSGKVRAGNSVFGLEKVASGSYYAIVQSGSESKKIPVILK